MFVFAQDLKAVLDGGRKLPFPDGILINGRGRNGYYLTVEQGRPSVYQSHATKNYSINYLTPRGKKYDYKSMDVLLFNYTKVNA
jgi:hypothetical protein